MSQRNGRRAKAQAKMQDKKMEKQAEIQEKRDKRQRQNTLHQQNLQLSQQVEHEKAVYLEKLMQTDMTDAGINLLDNMLDRSFVLGNINDAEYHDIKWQMQVMFLKIKSHFPPEESEVTGELRAFVLDDRDEKLEPLSGQQRTIIAQMIRGITMLVSRSKDGFQQEMNVKSISVSEVMDADETDEDSVKLGLFG
jgi:hypothetical protein